jgi:hypothetical protein
MEYDDEAAVTRYVWDYYGHLMTEVERQVDFAQIAELKAARGILRRRGIAGDVEAEAALANRAEAFRRRVCRRLLVERGGEIVVNRCPACRRVVRTPQARQCFWCGFDWHGCT